jgi:hypothetical protein
MREIPVIFNEKTARLTTLSAGIQSKASTPFIFGFTVLLTVHKRQIFGNDPDSFRWWRNSRPINASPQTQTE